MRAFAAGMLLVTLQIVGTSASGLAIPVQSFAACTGVAPQQTSCTTGEHILIGPQLNVTASPHYSGAILSRLIDPSGGELGTECVYHDGRVSGCVDYGVNWLGLAPLRHDCFSFEESNNSIQGGQGAWECDLSGVGPS